MAIIRNLAGLRKLASQSKPNTAAVGNWAVLQAVQRLSEWTNLGSHFKARLFMGKRKNKKQVLDVGLSAKDSEDAISNQWAALR